MATAGSSSSKKRLSEAQRWEIIAKLSKTDAPSERAIGREYGVSEGAIRKLWDNREQIKERSILMTEETRAQTFRGSMGRFKEVEDELYLWIENMRRAKLEVPPSLAIAKAKVIATRLHISEEDFKASWQWLNCFRV
jgi:hypothetical protein